jgi:hypothetical protein
MTTTSAALRGWATELAAAYGLPGAPNIREPRHEHGGLSVDLEFARTTFQAVHWPTGALDISLGTDPDDVTCETHQVNDTHEMLRILRAVEASIRRMEAR